MEVHKILGNGFQPGRRAEVIYQRALAIELDKAGISYAREFEMTILYKGEDIGTRRVDFLVENKIMVEIKAVIQLEDVHLAQAINYLEAYHLEVGLLINRDFYGLSKGIAIVFFIFSVISYASKNSVDDLIAHSIYN